MDYSTIKEYTRHGGPYDRGSADCYYRVAQRPHYFKGATNSSERVEKENMTDAEIAAYVQGYQEQFDEKDWGNK